MENKDYANPNFYTPDFSQGTVDLGTNVSNGSAIPPGSGTIVGHDPMAPSSKHRPTLAGFLVSYSRTPNGELFELREGNNSIGSARTNTIRLNEKHVSGEHAKINISPSNEGKDWKLQIVDLSSVNGTYVNSERLDIYSGFTLNNNSKLKIGEYELLLMVIPRNSIQTELNPNFKETAKTPDYTIQSPSGLGTTNVSL